MHGSNISCHELPRLAREHCESCAMCIHQGQCVGLSDHAAILLARLTTAERVRRLEEVAEAAEIIQGYESFEDNFGKLGADLDAALAALADQPGAEEADDD